MDDSSLDLICDLIDKYCKNNLPDKDIAFTSDNFVYSNFIFFKTWLKEENRILLKNKNVT